MRVLPLDPEVSDTDILTATVRLHDGAMKAILADDHILMSGPNAQPKTSDLIDWCGNVRSAIQGRLDMKAEQQRYREPREPLVEADNTPEMAPDDYVRRGYEAAADRKERARLEFVAAQDAFVKWEKLHKALGEDLG